MKKYAVITCFFLTIIILFGCQKNVKKGIESNVNELTLSNGMKWFIYKRGYAPVFAGILQFRVGGADEVKGKTGIAHLLEHMSFKGTRAIGTKNYEAEKDIMDKLDLLTRENAAPDVIKKLVDEQRKYILPNELWDIFTRNGASNLNAYTSKDVTTYHAEMPNSKLELWMFLVSRMISDPVFREFYTEKNVVLEELRTSIENSPKGKLYESLLREAFDNSPYSWPTIGIKDDVAGLTSRDLVDFYQSKYLPECIVGAIVGDIDVNATKKLLEKYFGGLKGKGTVCEKPRVVDLPQTKEIKKEIEFDAEPMLVMGFHKPTIPNFDDYVFDVFSYLLCEGESSRMQKDLVKEKRIAKDVSCFNSYPGVRLDDLFVVYGEPFEASALEPLRVELIAELERLKTEPVQNEELERVRNQVKMSFLSEIETNFELGHMLAYFENIAGSWRYILDHSKNIDKITPEDLLRVAKEYFRPENMTTILLKRKAGK